jgi:hypothetical protein
MALENRTCPVCKLLVIVDTARPGRYLNPQANLQENPSSPHLCTGALKAGDLLPETAYPYAINGSNEDAVVYYVDGRTAHGLNAPKGPVHPPLRPYTDTESKQRRRLAESRLGELALIRPALTAAAVGKVSGGVLEYVEAAQKANQAVVPWVCYCMRKYLYSRGGFGRIGQPSDCPAGDDDVMNVFRNTLAQGELASILGIQDFMGRLVFHNLRGTEGQNAVFNRVGSDVRPAYLFGRAEEGRRQALPPTEEPRRAAPARKSREERVAEGRARGRIEADNDPVATDALGLMAANSSVKPREAMQARIRGIDRWEELEDGGPTFNVNVHQRKLIYGAGPSGSTGTLLQAGKLFGRLDRELLKQYVFAIVGYLVGGGMHSYHEVMLIANRTGCPYKIGAMKPSLPQTLLDSLEGAAFLEKFYDIAVLGARLWTLRPAQTAVGKLDKSRIESLGKMLGSH